jgi:PEP-CTERM motif
MKKVVLLALFALALPTVALANTVDYAGFGDSTQGTASFTGTLATSSTVTLTLGSVSISGGAFQSGSVVIAATLGSSCGSGCFNIASGTVNISVGSSTLFSGTFSSGTVTVNNNIVNIQGFTTGGSTVATVINMGRSGLIGSSDTIVTPEPGTLGLLGTGLVGLAGIVRRKLRG